MDNNNPQASPRTSKHPPHRKRYHKPVLRLLGTLRELTRGAAGSGTDAGQHQRHKRGIG